MNPRDAARSVDQHFAHLDPDAFRGAVARDVSETTHLDNRIAVPENEQLALVPVVPVPLQLTAYLASALSGLDPLRREEIFHVSDVVAEVCRTQGIDLYEPRHVTDPVTHPRVDAPLVFEIDRDRVLESDLLIHLTHAPSTGAGEELDFAYNAMLPILLLSPAGRPVSRMITGLPGVLIQITYSSMRDLVVELREVLTQIKPELLGRKLAFSSYEANIVGDRIRRLREGQRLSRDMIAAAVGGLSAETLRHIEESSDRLSNPSLLHLRQLASALNTTVADLVEPDLGERLVTLLNDWMVKAARGESGPGALSRRDSQKMLRRFLIRMAESFDESDDGAG